MFKNAQIWLPGYLASRKRGEFVLPTHVFFCFVDHYEPQWHSPTREVARSRTQHWVENYPKMADRFRDADGRPPQHTFFFPSEEYQPEYFDDMAALCKRGYAETEIHLHHDNDTAEGLRRNIEEFKIKLQNHGFLSQGRYGFIHGNWCLDNSRADGRWCGVNNELIILKETGCYADFTLPSAPSDTQTRKVNSIYYATDDPQRPKSHDTGVDVRVGGQTSGDLMIVQGPLGLNWRERKFGILPRIADSDVAAYAIATPARIDSWIQQRIGVIGKPDWIFVKVHTHGCQERNFSATCGAHATQMHEYLQAKYNDGKRFILHYVTAREVYNLIKAAEAGKSGEPDQYRDFVLVPPPVRKG